MAERYRYFCDVAATGHLGRLAANLTDLGRTGWRLVAVLPYVHGEPGDLLLIWERVSAEIEGAREVRDR
jgi:hypothetical protein